MRGARLREKVKNYWGYTSVFIKKSLRNVSVQVFKENFLSGVEHSANKETIPQVVAYKRLNTMENDKANQPNNWSRLLTRGGRI